MKEQIKAPEIIQLSNEEIANLTDVQVKRLVITVFCEEAHRTGWIWSQIR